MTSCTNAALGAALGLSHSTVSRMRSAKRTGSPRVQMRLAEITGIPYEDVTRAAISARDGDRARWDEILEAACDAEQ